MREAAPSVRCPVELATGSRRLANAERSRGEPMNRRSLTVLMSLALVGMASLPVAVAAQDASPVAELGPPSASECQVAPRSEAEIAALAGTPTATNGNSEAAAPIELPEGTQVDQVTQDAIEQTLRE